MSTSPLPVPDPSHQLHISPLHIDLPILPPINLASQVKDKFHHFWYLVLLMYFDSSPTPHPPIEPKDPDRPHTAPQNWAQAPSLELSFYSLPTLPHVPQSWKRINHSPGPRSSSRHISVPNHPYFPPFPCLSFTCITAFSADQYEGPVLKTKIVSSYILTVYRDWLIQNVPNMVPDY